MAKKANGLRIKNRYVGYFNFHRELLIEYAYAYTTLQAKCIMMRRIANKHNVSYFTVFNHFKDTDNCKIQLETEFKES